MSGYFYTVFSDDKTLESVVKVGSAVIEYGQEYGEIQANWTNNKLNAPWEKKVQYSKSFSNVGGLCCCVCVGGGSAHFIIKIFGTKN